MAIKKVTVKDLAPQIKKPWMPVLLGKVENYDIKLAEFKGEYFWHKHEEHDEFIYVWKGAIALDMENDKSVSLKSGEGALIEKNTIHRSKSQRKSLVLIIERETILSDFVRVE